MTPEHLVCFAHGKESGPWGTKITYLAETARRRGFMAISPDYSHTHDPRARLSQLLELAPRADGALVLVGSSMGGWVSAMACADLRPNALLLMAPALYFPGFDEEPPAPPALTAVVHGWHDDIVPVERAIRYAKRHAAALHLLDSGHTLNDQLSSLEQVLDPLLQRAVLDAAYRAADYVIDAPGGEIVLQVDRYDAIADGRLSSECGVREHWAIVTASNPHSQLSPADDNRARAEELRNAVDRAGARRMPASGRDPLAQWPAERGELLCDPPSGFAEELGRRFRQNAIVFARLGESPRLRWL